VAVFAIATASGCYESDFPLDPSPQLGVWQAWLGTWRCLPVNADADEQPATLRVKLGPERWYDVTWQEGSKQDRYEGFTSVVVGTRFVNLRELKPDGKTGQWVFVRPTLLRPNVLQLQVVDDDAMKGVEASAPAMRRAIEQKLSDPALTVDFCVCVRAKEPTEPSP
jgi:hypothetical protein